MPPNNRARNAEGLTPREQMFVAEYLVNGGNGSQAAIAATYSAHTASQAASQLLRRPHVRAALDRRRQAVEVRTGVTVAQVVERLAEIAFGPISEEVPSSSVLRALELLGKHLGMYVERHEVRMESVVFTLDLGGAELEEGA